MTAEDYQALREACAAFSAQGIQLQTVIPVALPAEQYPAKGSGKQGSPPKPAFCGKNPSCWIAAGKPQLLSHRNPASLDELNCRIDVAERLGQPIGLAVIPSTDLEVLDFDLKNYPNPEALEADWMGLLDRHPELTRTRIERTPRGGIHIYLKLTDGMAGWRTQRGTLHCNFTMSPGGDHRGEVLAGTRVCVCAPTISDVGYYELVNPQFAYCIVEIPSLESIGIYPVAKSKADAQAACGDRLGQASPAEDPRPRATSKVPALEDLIGAKAKDVLAGGAPYRGRGGESVDRSAQLTGFVREVYSWGNLLTEHQLSFSGSAEALIAKAVAVLVIDDKADRVLDGIDPADCRHADPERALRQYHWLAGNRAWRSGRAGETRKGDSTQAGPADPSSPPPLSREECRDRLQDAVARHQSPTEQELLLGELADASDLHPAELRQLLAAIRLEAEQRDQLLQQASAIGLDLERQQARSPISLEGLFPPPLGEALRRITEHLPYSDHVVATTYLAGISGLVKLGTTICGNPYTDFVTPANLYVATVGRSGQKKTPLEKLLVRRPARELIREMAAENSRVMEHWREQCKGCKRKDERPPQPVPLYLQIQDYTSEALVALLQELDKRGLSVLVLRDELSGLFGAMNAYRSGKGADEQQLLELFDGHAITSLRVSAGDRSYERCQVSIYGAIQPGVLRELIKGGDPSGKWARFLFSPLPESTRPLPTAISEDGVAAVNAAMQLLEVYARRIYTLPAQRYRLDPEAIELFSAYEHDKQQRAQQVRLEAQGSLYGKSAGKVLRVVVLLHLLTRVVLGTCVQLEVSAEMLQRAIALVDYLDNWALGFHEQAAAGDGDGGISSLMRRIHTLARKAKGPVSWSQLRQQMSGREKKNISVALAEEAMRALAQLEIGEVSDGPRGGLLYRATADLLV